MSESIVVRELERARWQGRTLTFDYTTDGYFDFDVHDKNFAMVYKPFAEARHKSFTDTLFADWPEAPTAYGAFRGSGDLAGVIEGSIEGWNNRFRISNLLVLEGARGHGVGELLMARMLDRARETGARMAVPETQSCNVRAIGFYERCGFSVIGFDLFAYSNNDVEKGEVRVEMGRRL